jgi:hypothetical protein
VPKNTLDFDRPTTVCSTIAQFRCGEKSFRRGPEEVAARNAALKDEAERVGAFYVAQEKAREQRDAAEARAAREHGVKRGRQAGWG